MEDSRYDVLFYESFDAIVKVDRSFCILDVNETFIRMFKYSRDELIGVHIDTIFVVDKDIEKIRQNTVSVLNGNIFYDEGQRVDKNGIYHDVLITGLPVYKNNVIDGAFITYKDITREKEALRALAKQETIFKSLFSNSPDAIIRFDLDHKAIEINEQFTFLFGYTIEEIRGISIDKIIVNPESYEYSSSLTQKLLQGEKVSVEGIRIGKNNKAVHVTVKGVPIMNDFEIIGGFGIYTDITDRKQSENKIIYMSYHDSLTGLYNRRFFEEELKRLDKARNLPLGMIMCDANGLKLTNDVFGHQVGDELLKKIAYLLTSHCRGDEIIARLGGDEFVILLPHTQIEDIVSITRRIKKACESTYCSHLPLSLSFGYSIKTSLAEDSGELFKRAEDMMYQTKLLESHFHKKNTIKTLMDSLHLTYPLQADHSKRVSAICEGIARALGLVEREIWLVKEIGWYHDIGKIGININSDLETIKKHPEIGSRIVSSISELSEYADIILSHHENYDGTGFPKGLRNNEIPLLARIVAVADAFEILTSTNHPDGGFNNEAALKKIAAESNRYYDPFIVNALIKFLDLENGFI